MTEATHGTWAIIERFDDGSARCKCVQCGNEKTFAKNTLKRIGQQKRNGCRKCYLKHMDLKCFRPNKERIP